MANKAYQITDDEPMTVCEPAVAYNVKTSNSDRWNPNVPIHCTQEEFWEHIHHIETGNFMTLEEFDLKFETWKTKYLASKLK